MSNYSNFALVYDTLMSDVNYAARTEYLLKLFEKHDRRPTLMLDLACGTGGFSTEFANSGVEVIGVDMSEEMLSVARQKAYNNGNDILFLCQKAEELDLYGTVDGAICCFDSLNHIIDYNDLCKAIKKVSLFLEKERLFIFDVNTVFKHKEVLGNNIFVIEQEGVYCVWQNQTDNQTLVTDILLDFFIEDGEHYIRATEEFSERAYTDKQLEDALSSAGLEILRVYDDILEDNFKTDSQRKIYVTKKV